jgi:hypothetical protein
MPSPAQYAANRLKAIENESARPYTPQTGTRSGLNAGRHGVTARVVVLTTQDLAAYKQFSREIVDSLDAQTPLERQFAYTIADNQWRINRSRSIEDGMLGLGHSEVAGDFDADHPEIHAVMTAAKGFRDHSQAFVNLSICEQRLHRALKDALRQLKDLQAERRELAEKGIGFVLPASIPSQPEIGFVLQNAACPADDLPADDLPADDLQTPYVPLAVLPPAFFPAQLGSFCKSQPEGSVERHPDPPPVLAPAA